MNVMSTFGQLHGIHYFTVFKSIATKFNGLQYVEANIYAYIRLIIRSVTIQNKPQCI